MVAKRRTKKKTTALKQLSDGLAVIARVEIVGLSLVLISVFTLLSLLTGSRGSVTGLWIDLLRVATGDGVAGVPLLTGFLGLWMVLRAIDGPDRRTASGRSRRTSPPRDQRQSGSELPTLPWRMPTGLLLIFLAYIAAITLLLPPMTRAARVLDGGAGGALGLFFANTLANGLPAWGAWAVILLIALSGLTLLTGRRLWDALWAAGGALTQDIWDTLQEMWREEPHKRLFQPGTEAKEKWRETTLPHSSSLSPLRTAATRPLMRRRRRRTSLSILIVSRRWSAPTDT